MAVVVTVVVTVETALLPRPWRSFPLGPVGPVEPGEPGFGFLPPADPDGVDGCGAVADVVVVVAVGVGVVLVEVGGAGVGVVTVAEGVVEVDVVAGVQLAETRVSPGGTSDAGGVPGAALTVIVVVPPVGSATTSVHVSAEAVGIAAIAIVARTMLTVMTTVFSLRLFDTLL